MKRPQGETDEDYMRRVARCTKCGGPIMRWESYRIAVQLVGGRDVRSRVHLSCPKATT